MRVIAFWVVAYCLVGTAVRAENDNPTCTCTAEAAEVSSLKATLAGKEQEASDLQKQIEGLRGQLAALTSKSSQAESDLSNAQTRLKAVEGELTSTDSKLKQAEVMLADAKKELSSAEQASRDSVSTCKRTLEKVQSDLSEHAARISELKALEEALLPAWLSRSITKASVFSKAQWERLQESDLYGQAVEKLRPHWDKAMTASQPAREAAAVYVAKAQESLAKLPIQDAVKSVKVQVSNIERELHMVVKQLVTSQPSFAGLNDPVTIQLLVYSIMGLPVALLSLLLVSLVGGPGKSAKAATGKAAGNVVTAKRAPSTGKSKGVAVQQTPAGKGKRGKAIKDGGDVLYAA